MYLLEAEGLIALGEIPRFDDPRVDGFRKKYTDIQPYRQECFVLFLSHRWLSAHYDPAAQSGSDAAVSSGHPDDPADGHPKHKLLATCLSKMKDGQLKGKRVLIWIDFSCLSQAGGLDIQRGIESLPSYIERCDSLLTVLVEQDRARTFDDIPAYFNMAQKSGIRGMSPVLGDAGAGASAARRTAAEQDALIRTISERTTRPHIPGLGMPTPAAQFMRSWHDLDRLYPAWVEYRSRGWCRIEFFVGSNAPMHPDCVLDPTSMRKDRRHLVYTKHEAVRDAPPAILPPFRHYDLQTLHPCKGNLTNPNDQEKIALLMAPLEQVMEVPPAPGYVGDVDEDGLPHGQGTHISDNGDSYTGDWVHGNMEGSGTRRYLAGVQYEGGYKQGKWDGDGYVVWPSGNTYDGQWRNGNMHGLGEKKCADGERYKGGYDNFEKHGQGEWLQKDGTHYKGGFDQGKRSGFGVLTQPNGGDVWSGTFVNDQPDGSAPASVAQQ
jgi:hypothetical protein